MDDGKETERIVREVTGRVLDRLGAAGRQAGEAILLLPVATGSTARALAFAAQLEEKGIALATLGAPAVVEELARLGLAGRLGGRVESFAAADVGRAIAGMGPGSSVVIGSIGFASAAALARLEDGDPFVRLVTQARLKGCTVAMAPDDLAGNAGADAGPLGERARALLRELALLGIETAPWAELAALVERRRALGGSAAKVAGRLVTEEDVEALARAGETTLHLPRGTVVTPLAQTRAYELGVQLRRDDG